MKKKAMAGLIAIIVIVSVAIFVGCVEKEAPVSTPTPTATPFPQITPTSTPRATPSPTVTPIPTPTPPLTSTPFPTTTIIVDQTPKITLQGDYYLFESPESSFKIKYPKGWAVYTTAYNGSVMKSKGIKFMGRTATGVHELHVEVTQYQEIRSLKDIVNDLLTVYPSAYKDFNLLENKETQFLGYPANKLTYTYSTPTKKIQKMEIVFLKDNRSYEISYWALIGEYGSNINKIQEYVNSFRFV